MKNLSKILVVCLVILCCLSPVYAQTKKEKEAAIAEEVKNMINTKNYLFVPTYANSSGGSFQVASSYNLKILKDSVTSYLPYYGNASFSVDDPTNGNIKLQWTNYNYTIKEGKKGSVIIEITPGDKSSTSSSDIKSVTLRVSPDGSASLQLVSDHRGSMSFDGYLADKY